MLHRLPTNTGLGCTLCRAAESGQNAVKGSNIRTTRREQPKNQGTGRVKMGLAMRAKRSSPTLPTYGYALLPLAVSAHPVRTELTNNQNKQPSKQTSPTTKNRRQPRRCRKRNSVPFRSASRRAFNDEPVAISTEYITGKPRKEERPPGTRCFPRNELLSLPYLRERVP